VIRSTKEWAREQFGSAKLGDARREMRLLRMAASAARRPSGKVSEVFTRAKDREGAYDFLENPHVDVSDVAESMFAASAARAKDEAVVYVSIDLSSLALTDLDNEKFGPIGSPNAPVRGLMVANALAIATAHH
jgi:hypothetical protein